MVRRLQKLDPKLVPQKIKDAIADIDAETLLTKVNQLEQERPADILSALKGKLKSVQRTSIATPNGSGYKAPKVKPLFQPEDDY